MKRNFPSSFTRHGRAVPDVSEGGYLLADRVELATWKLFYILPRPYWFFICFQNSEIPKKNFIEILRIFRFWDSSHFMTWLWTEVKNRYASTLGYDEFENHVFMPVPRLIRELQPLEQGTFSRKVDISTIFKKFRNFGIPKKNKKSVWSKEYVKKISGP